MWIVDGNVKQQRPFLTCVHRLVSIMNEGETRQAIPISTLLIPIIVRQLESGKHFDKSKLLSDHFAMFSIEI